MAVLSTDTSSVAERLQIELYRQSSPARKRHMLNGLVATARRLAIAGIRRQYPDVSNEELQHRLAERWLGHAVAARTYLERAPMPLSDSSLDPLITTTLITQTLETLAIPYVVTGSLASIMHGEVRLTRDADIVAAFEQQHVEPFLDAITDAFYADEQAIRGAIRTGRSFNVIHFDTAFKVDVFVSHRRPFDESRFARRIRQRLDDDSEHTLYVASAEDTILAKLEWYRQGGEVSDSQWRDVLGILLVQTDTLDDSYLRTWARRLDVEDLLQRALNDVQSSRDTP